MRVTPDHQVMSIPQCDRCILSCTTRTTRWYPCCARGSVFPLHSTHQAVIEHGIVSCRHYTTLSNRECFINTNNRLNRGQVTSGATIPFSAVRQQPWRIIELNHERTITPAPCRGTNPAPSLRHGPEHCARQPLCATGKCICWALDLPSCHAATTSSSLQQQILKR
jgi:hypothetical protein